MKKPLFLVARAATPTKPAGFFSRVLSFGRTAMFLFLIICAICGSGQVWGQNGILSVNSSSLNELNDSLFFQKMKFCDNEGNSYSYEDLLLKEQLDYTYYYCSNPSSVFEVVFEDSPTINFLESQTTRDVICQVFTDMSALLMLQNSPCYPYQQKATILIKEDYLPSSVAARGGAIYSWETDEYSADGQVETGIVDNLAWLAINGNHPSGNGSYWPETHGMIIFNPLNNGYTWNIDNNVTTIPYNSVDLYSTTLHELLHVLGFDSAIGSDGESTLEFNGNNSATLNLYTRYDTYLKNSVNNNLVQNPDIVGDPYNWDFAGVIGDLTAISGCSVTFQDVASNSLSPIYTPANFINNQSLKHLLNDCTTPYPNYVMDPIVQGVVHRIPTVEEINMLCALGYHTTGIYGNQTVTDPCFKHIPVGRWEYGKNCSPLPSERFKITMCPGQESIDIAYSDILYNDVNVIDGTTTIVGLNVYDITQPGLEVTVTSYADHFTVAAQNTGIIDIDNAEIKLKYVPVTTMPNGDILYGNVTYVGILLNSCCYPIIPPYELTGCNLIPNPTLVIEDISNCNQNNYILKHNIGNYNYCVAGWGRLHHRPGSVPASILEEEATNVWSLPNLLNPVGYNMIRQVTTGITAAEGLALNDQEISITQVPVKTGKNYILSFLFCAANGVHQEITLDDYDVYLINSSDIQENCNYQQAPTQQVFTLPEPVNYPTKQGISCFTATQDWNNLFLKPINNTPQGIISFTTRLTLVEDVDKIIFESLDNTTTNATYSCGDNNSTITLFEPSLCSDITIAYTVTGSNGFSEVFINEPLVIPTPDCTTNYTITRSVVPWNTDYPEIQEAYDLLTSDGSQSLCSPPISITVVVQQVTSDVFTLSDDNVCVGESVTITANSNFSEATEHLYVNGTEVTINANHQYIYTPTTSGIIQVGFTWSNPGCCSAAYTQSITVNPLPTANITGNLSICSGQSTTLTANGGGTYTWSTTPQTTTAQITVSAGTYTVTVTTAQGCSATASATVAVNPLPNITTTATQPTCGLSNGSISVTPTGGAYNWTGGLSGSNPTDVAAGTYTVTVTSGGCSSTASVTLNTSTALTATATATQPTCGLSNGSISVTPIGGTYNWTGGLSDSNPTDVAAGTYTVTVTSGGCSSTASVTLNTSQAATANITGTTTICSGQSTTLTASGGGTYAWGNSPGVTIGTSATLNNIIAAGTYTVTVTNANGCSSITSKTVTVNPIPVAFVSGSSTICAGSSAILSVVGAGTYLWSNGQTSASINVSSAGTYTVTVTANGCNTTGTATIAVVQPSTTMSLS